MSEGNDDATRTARPTSTSAEVAPDAAPPQSMPSTGARLGRYVLREVIGRGGMGAVFRASDPELGRDVAIKVLLPGATSQRSQDRLLEEARAMAKLRHPAVLPVFDVGTTAHGVFVAMPLVEGGTLRDWLKREPRSWPSVVEKFLAAGRGLSAAHAAGIVHRDFKPTNVLLEADGLVQVADFGIASLASPDHTTGDGLASSVAGTPAYMAPEQASGKVVDARADQFSFCVSLWEGLYGERPGDAETETQRTPLSLDGVIARDGRDAAVPVWLRTALLRGLAFRPDDRWPSMDALLGEIERHTRPRRGKAPWIIAIAALAAVAFLVALIAFRGDGAKAVTAGPASPPPPPKLELSPPMQLTRTGVCAENPSFIAPGVVAFDHVGPTGVDLHTLDLAGGEPTRLTDGSFWEWRSRPGRRAGEIVYLGTNPSELGESYLGVFDVATRKDTSRIRAIAGGIGALGDDIYYAGINGTELHRTNGTENTLVASYEPASIATFAIDATTKRIAYVSGRGGPICHHVLGATDKPVCSSVKVRAHAPAFANAGAAIYAGNGSGVHRVEVSSGAETKLLDTDASGGLTISPDEKTIVYSSCRPLMTITDLTTSPETVLVDNGSASMPAVSSAGHMAWAQSVDGVRVLMFRAAGDKERQLTKPELGSVSHPMIDPTQNKVAFQVSGDKPGIYVATLDPNSVVTSRYTTDPNDRAASWYSPLGLAFERRHKDGPSTTHLIDTATGTITDVPGPNVYMTSNAATGELLVLTQAGRGKGLMWLNPTTRKLRPGPRGGPQVYAWAWVSPNGKWVSALGGSSAVIWRAELPDGEMTLVHEEEGGRSINDATIDDRGHILATVAEWKGELFSTSVRSGSL